MSEKASASEMFASFQAYLDAERDLREDIRTVVRELEQTVRETVTIMQGIHQHEGVNNVTEVCQKLRSSFPLIQEQFRKIAEKVPSGQYYRFHDHWRFTSQKLSFIAAFIVYLESEELIQREKTAEMLGIKVNKDDGFHLDLDDYLMGLLQLASELSRLAVNAVTAGDYRKPVQIKKFVTELDAGFRLLNLKNDALRKRYDALKYDMKKVEEVVYDLSIRGLKQDEPKIS